MHTYNYTEAKIGQTVFRFNDPQSDLAAKNSIEAIVANGELGLDITKEFLELHFYYQTDPPELARSVVVPLSRHDLQYRGSSVTRRGDVTTDHQIVGMQYDQKFWPWDKDYETIQLGLKFWDIDKPTSEAGAPSNIYTDYLADMPAGTYDLLINFFSSELGPVNDTRLASPLAATWKIAQISADFPEIILEPIGTMDDARMTEFEQFVDNSMFVRDFKQAIHEKFEHAAISAEGLLTPHAAIIARVKQNIEALADPDGENARRTWNYIDSHYWADTVKPLLTEILGEIFIEIDHWVEGEITANRFRITDTNFENALINKVGEILGATNAPDSYIRKFPESPSLFVNE